MAAKKKVNPFVDEGEGDGTPETVESEPVISLDDEDDGEEDDDPVDRSGPAQSRQEKRASRSWMNRQEREQIIRERDDARAQAERDRIAAHQATVWAQQIAQQAPQQTQKDPIDEAEDLVKRERSVLFAEYQARVSKGVPPPEEQAKYEERAQALERRATEIQVARTVRNMGLAPQNPQQAQREAFVANLRQRYPEVMASPAALTFAGGIQAQLKARGRGEWDADVIDEAMTGAEKEFRIGKHKTTQRQTREPDPVLRDRYAGAPRGSSGGSRGEGPQKVSMTKEMRKMANAAYGHIKDEPTRYKMWYKAQAEQSDE